MSPVLSKAHARRLVLTGLGYRSLPDDDGPAFTSCDFALTEGFGLAFYRKGEQVVTRVFGGSEPRLGPAEPLEELGEWRLVGVYTGEPLFRGRWREGVLGMSVRTVLTATVRNIPEGTMELTLFHRAGKLVLQGAPPGRPEEIQELMSYPEYEVEFGGLLSRKTPLRFPTGANVEIECDGEYTSQVAAAIRLSADPSANTFKSLWGGRRPKRLTALPGLTPLDLRINGVLHFAASYGDDWSLIPVNASGRPKLKKTLARTDYRDDTGNLITEEIGDVGHGRLITLTTSKDDPSRNSCTLGSGRPDSFAAQVMSRWRLLPVVVDELLEGKSGAAGLQPPPAPGEKVEWHGADPDFVELLLPHLPEDGVLSRRIRGYLAHGHPRRPLEGKALLDVFISTGRDDGIRRRVLQHPEKEGVLVEVHDGFRQPEQHPLPATELTAVLDAHPELLTFPAAAEAVITSDEPDLVLDRLTLTGDPLPRDSRPPLAHPADNALDRFSDLRPLDLTINDIPYLAADLKGTWKPLPIAEDGTPAMHRIYAHSSFCYGYYSGSNDECIGLVRPGLTVSWSAPEEGIDARLALSDGDPLEFTATALRAWVFHPAVLDDVLGTQTTEDTYGRDIAEYESYSYHLDLEPEEIPCFRAFLTE